MRFLSMVKHTEGKSSPPSKSMMEALGQLLQELAKEGCVMVQSGGLFPTNAGARVRLAGGKVTVTDGPFTEAKEVVGGYAIFDVPSKAHMIRLTERFTACFADRRMPELVEHSVGAMVMQRVFGIALGYEDLTDHDELRHDPVLAVLAGKLAARRSDCAALAGKSTLNRLELSQAEPTRYHRISHDGPL